MEEMFKTLPQHSCSWLKGWMTMYNHQGYWNAQRTHKGAILAQQKFKARKSDVFLCTSPKTGTTWLKALAFAIVTREKFNEFNSPLLTAQPHALVPFLETELDTIEENREQHSSFPLMAAHVPYTSLPESIIASDCKIVYMYRNIKDVVVSNYHFWKEIAGVPVEDAPFDEAFEEFCQGISVCGPYWDHILGYQKASLERPGRILLLKYEDLKTDATSHVKRLAEFIGYPFTSEEENAGVVEKIINLCSFKNLSNLEVNKTGKSTHLKNGHAIENRLAFRKAKDGDWKNYFTDEMKEKIDKLIDEKLSGTGLVLK